MAQDMFDNYQTRFIRGLLAEKAESGSTREKGRPLYIETNQETVAVA